MSLVPIPDNSVLLGRPVPFSLHNRHGELLLARGSCIDDTRQLDHWLWAGLFVDVQEAEAFERAYKHQLDNMLRGGALLGKIAHEIPKMKAEDLGHIRASEPVLSWPDIHERLRLLLRDPRADDFEARLQKIAHDLTWHAQRSPDTSLLRLILTASESAIDYCATHSLLTGLLCQLCAVHVESWDTQAQHSLVLAALSMNISMATMQDHLAVQHLGPAPAQRELIQKHSDNSVALLQSLGVDDPLWLDAVAFHHAPLFGRMTEHAVGQQLARMIQRAVLFGAALSPRQYRAGRNAARAAQAAILDGNRKPDEAGTMLVKTIGLYPPGTWVRLASGELALVVHRSQSPETPRVLSFVGRNGMLLGEPAPRDTRQPQNAVVQALAASQVKVRINLEKLLKLL